MTLQSLLDFCSTIPGCSGRITMERDELYGVEYWKHRNNPEDEERTDHGYTAFVSAKDVIYTGRGLTPEEALDKLEEKLKAKFKV